MNIVDIVDIVDKTYTWAETTFADDFKTIEKDTPAAALGRWRATLPMLAITDLEFVEELVTLHLGGEGMRRLTVTLAFDVFDTTESEVRRLTNVVREALWSDLDWGNAVDTGDVRISGGILEPFDFDNTDAPLPFLARRITASGLKFGA